MSFGSAHGYDSSPGMYLPAYRVNVTTSTPQDWYFVVCNYTGTDIADNDLLGAILAAVQGLSGVETVQVVEYSQATQDVTASL